MALKRPNPNLTEKARSLRQNQTSAEALLWSRLRSRQLEGMKFRRQYRIGSHIVDFACIELNLAIELDGGQHSEATVEDTERSRILQLNGWRVLRFWNNEVFTNLEGVIETIRMELPHPHPSPLPAGEGVKPNSHPAPRRPGLDVPQ